MSDIDETPAPTKADVETLIEANPKVDGDQLREAQALVDKLRKDGFGRPSYRITSPYQRQPSRRARRGT